MPDYLGRRSACLAPILGRAVSTIEAPTVVLGEELTRIGSCGANHIGAGYFRLVPQRSRHDQSTIAIGSNYHRSLATQIVIFAHRDHTGPAGTTAATPTARLRQQPQPQAIAEF
jgi:hypothetical protein